MGFYLDAQDFPVVLDQSSDEVIGDIVQGEQPFFQFIVVDVHPTQLKEATRGPGQILALLVKPATIPFSFLVCSVGGACELAVKRL